MGAYTRGGAAYKIIVDNKKALLKDLVYFLYEHLIIYYQKYEFVVVIQ